MIKTVLFDLDDTLLDFHRSERVALTETLSQCGIEPTDATIKRYSEINRAMWEQLELGRMTREEILVRRFTLLFDELGVDADGVAAKRSYEWNLGGSYFYIEGAEALLEEMSKKYDLYVMSNGTASVQDRRIKGKAIIVSNHNYLMDFAVLMFVFWRRTLRCAVAELMYHKNFVMTFLLHFLGCVKVERDSHDFSFLTDLKKILDKGGVVEIYPEARLPKKGEERPLEFKPSYVYLALESGAPIIPIYNNAKTFSKERERVIIGKPIPIEELYDASLSEKENIDKINTYVRSKIIELAKELERQQAEE